MTNQLRTLLIFAFALSLITTPGWAQDDDQRDERGRRISTGDPVVLNFNKVKVSEVIDFIVETSGKTVIPSASSLTMTVTVVNDIPLPRDEALNRLFIALLDHEIGVIETDTLIKLDLVGEIAKGDCPVVGADERLEGRRDEGVIINKVFQLRFADAESVSLVLEELVPDEWAAVEVETNSNSIIALCNIGLGKKLEALIDNLDKESIYETDTILLQYADATAVAERILELYGPSNSSGGSGNRNQQNNRNDPRTFRGGVPQGGGGSRSGAGGELGGGLVELRAVADPRNNSVTVIGEPSLVKRIRKQVEQFWDVEFDPSETVIRTYTIIYRDVIVIRDLLNEISGQASPTAGQGVQRGGTRAGTNASDGGASTRFADLFLFQADPGANQLIVTAKTSASFDIIDNIIAQLDQASEAEQPTIIKLKHADAGELAEEINILLAERDSQIQTTVREQGLQEFNLSDRFGDGGGDGGGGGDTTGQDQQGTPFPWLSAQDDPSVAPVSPLIGKVRVMPFYRQNSLLLLGAPHYKSQVATIIAQLDKPGRQVLITAVIAEVQLNDALSLGLRWGRADNFGSTENAIGGSADLTGDNDSILRDLFDTSLLNVNISLAAVIEALKRETQVRVLSQPRIYTHDNEQANFFDGQRIQVVDESNFTDTGTLNQSFDFETVGIVMSVRPRITAERDVDIEVDLELSSLGGTTAGGGLIFDTRRTTTRVIVKDRQTIIISGILRERESKIVRKIPFFGDIPLFGALFTSTESEDVVTELVAFITPIVIENPEESDALNEPMQDRLDDLKRPLDEQLEDFGESATAIWGRSAAETAGASESDVRNSATIGPAGSQPEEATLPELQTLETIRSMSRTELISEIASVARAKQLPRLTEGQRAQLDEQFDLLKSQLEVEASGG